MLERPYRPSIGRKQLGNNAGFQRAWEGIRSLVPRWYVDALVELAAQDTRQLCAGLDRVAYGWSGGKDSIALGIVMRAAGVDKGFCVLSDLEFTAFREWVMVNKPAHVAIERRSQINLPWLAQHQQLLFPNDSATSLRWFVEVQRKGQKAFYDREGLQGVLLGRRKADGNHPRKSFTDRDGRHWIAPIMDWTHEDVMAVCHYYGPPMPPIYSWPRGWTVGTGPWAKRRVASHRQGWSEVMAIEPAIVDAAALYLPSARQFLALRED